jgi:hypothetical protein
VVPPGKPGRTSLFILLSLCITAEVRGGARRFNNHLKADSGSKLHVFLNLVGWEHFNISIIEVCSPEVQGAKENFYLQKYLPLLNTTFSSSFSESLPYNVRETTPRKGLVCVYSSPEGTYPSGKVP